MGTIVGSSFENDLRKFAKKIERTLDETHRGVVIKLFSQVIMLTPVDQGFLRGGWAIGHNTPPGGYTKHKDPAGTKGLGAVRSNPGRAGTISYLINGMPYATVAEYGRWGTGPGATIKTTRDGYSVQAPYGMVRISVARFNSIVKQVVATKTRAT